MTNDEIPNVEDPLRRDERMTNSEARRTVGERIPAGNNLVIRHSSFFRHSTLVIRNGSWPFRGIAKLKLSFKCIKRLCVIRFLGHLGNRLGVDDLSFAIQYENTPS